MAVIGTRYVKGATSLAYRNVRPKNPIGKNKLKRNKKALATPKQATLLLCLIVPAMMNMQVPMPMADTIISLRRPKRSTVRTPMGAQQV